MLVERLGDAAGVAGGSSHAFEETTAVNAVFVVVVFYYICSIVF